MSIEDEDAVDGVISESWISTYAGLSLPTVMLLGLPSISMAKTWSEMRSSTLCGPVYGWSRGRLLPSTLQKTCEQLYNSLWKNSLGLM